MPERTFRLRSAGNPVSLFRYHGLLARALLSIWATGRLAGLGGIWLSDNIRCGVGPGLPAGTDAGGGGGRGWQTGLAREDAPITRHGADVPWLEWWRGCISCYGAKVCLAISSLVGCRPLRGLSHDLR